jgi:Na+/H+-dicarboxylate symporter
MRLNAAGAVFVACAMVAAAIGIIASRALLPGFTRMTSDETLSTTAGAVATHAPLLRHD